ncbi:hypothetical protein TPB0596_06000 [Tsukamurella pulmonis]|uniref:Uncharacterized protein n=2 Tax=Tsukamurella pulmonis TaxID=47312 RepID=A0A1H1HI92_9ACTN|nr:hypothetical protein AXK56_18840 [Tsukamurella pulmonis]BDD80837.1 hypothetical protein TPB0596_06000 [Tsukamurella pulmonis]SDR25107.1 hypothetical protein SAMN04489765_4228 [Tsukamurella pulmonis]SUP14505.1 Uncharacterised protein [Tsukamurella pulmonis]
MDLMNAYLSRTLVASVATVAAATAAVAPAAAAPGRVGTGPLTYAASALPGWSVKAPAPDGTVLAVAKLPGKNWASMVEIGPTGVAGRSASDVARAIAESAPTASGYEGHGARVVGLQVTPTTISGVPAARAVATVQVDGAPVAGDRYRVVVVDTKPQTYFVTAVPAEAPDRTAQAGAAEASLVAAR